MKTYNVLLSIALFAIASTTFAGSGFKNKDAANSALNDRQRTFMNQNIFGAKLDLAPWNRAFDDALKFIEDNSRSAGLVGSRDKVIMGTIELLRSANRTIMSTISNAYNEYVMPRMRIEEARTYVMDNMIAARNVLIGVEKDAALTQVREDALLPGKKNAVQLAVSLALKLKTIANKAIDDFKIVAPMLTKEQRMQKVVNQLDDLWLTRVQEEMRQMEMHLKNVPSEKANVERWYRQVMQLNQQIAQVYPAAAKKYDERIKEVLGDSGLTHLIKPSLQ